MKQKNKKQGIKTGVGATYRFTLFSLVVFIAIPLVFISASADSVQPVRLLVLSFGLIVFGVMLFFDRMKKLPVKSWNNPLIWFVGAYVFITAGSMAFAVNVKETYFDIARGITFFVFTLFAIAVFYEKKNWPEPVAKYVIVAATISVIIGFYQFITKAAGHETGFLADGRPVIYEVKGMMAHKNQYAINLMLMLPPVVYGFLTFNKKIWRRYAAIACVLMIVMIILLHTRSVWTALLIATPTLTLAAFFRHEQLGLSLRQRNLLFISVFSAILLIMSIIVFVPAKDEFSRLGMLKSIAHPEAGNNMYRLKIWKVTADMIADHPVTGVGAGNWKLRSAEYYSGHDLGRGQLNWLRPHNDFLWVFAEKGIAGALVYLGMMAITLYYLLIAFLLNKEKNDRLFALLIAGGFIGYQVISMFTFPLERINQQIFLHLYMAAAVLLYLKSRNKTGGAKIRRRVIFSPLLFLLFPIAYSISIVKSDAWLVKARTSLQREAWSSLVYETSRAETWARNLDSDAIPLGWYTGIGLWNTNQRREAIMNNEQALKAHPNNISLLHNLGVTNAQIGDYDKAIYYFQRALNILPDLRETIEALSTIYFEQRNFKMALETLERIKLERRTQANFTNLQILRRILLGLTIDEAFRLRKQGKEEEAWERFESATRVYSGHDRFLRILEQDHAHKFDDPTLLRLLRFVPYLNRSENYQNRIEQLKNNIAEEDFSH